MHVRVVIVESYEERKYKENDLFGLHTFAYRLGVWKIRLNQTAHSFLTSSSLFS